MEETAGDDVSRKKAKGTNERDISYFNFDTDSFVTHLLKSFNLLEVDTSRQSDSDKELVNRVLMFYDFLRRKFAQLDDAKAVISGARKRPDLKAGAICMNKNVRANTKKRVGHVPGVEVGDIFFFRFELCLVGLHSQTIAGIDLLSIDEEPVAISIVSLVGNENENDDGNTLIYSGQGGFKTKEGTRTNQELKRGNLALEKSLYKGNKIRVIRGFKDHLIPTGKVYVYDGLYKVRESWIEKSKSGSQIFKYKLIRLPNQPEAFTLWKKIQKWKKGQLPRPKTIISDISSGVESLPVSLFNDVDNETEMGHANFAYIKTLKQKNPFPSTNSSSKCKCVNGCNSNSNSNCTCAKKNDGFFPYSSLGFLLSHNKLIYECGNSCRCPSTCRNRVSQSGLKIRLEVFKTKNKGWGLRSWDPIRAGGFICEYAGVVIKGKGADIDDNYVFDATRVFDAVETVPNDEIKNVTFPFPLVISAKNEGNVGRFMNHSCMPNVYWQPIVREYQDDAYYHVGFYAIRHIPPLTELTLNYGNVRGEKGGPRRKKCLCGSPRCTGSFY